MSRGTHHMTCLGEKGPSWNQRISGLLSSSTLSQIQPSTQRKRSPLMMQLSSRYGMTVNARVYAKISLTRVRV